MHYEVWFWFYTDYKGIIGNHSGCCATSLAMASSFLARKASDLTRHCRSDVERPDWSQGLGLAFEGDLNPKRGVRGGVPEAIGCLQHCADKIVECGLIEISLFMQGVTDFHLGGFFM